jgi:hypothetical protein
MPGFKWLITNLPYDKQNELLLHILPIAKTDGCSVAILARSEWSSAKGRGALMHDNPRFSGEVRLTRRPVWVKPATSSPRHLFSWFVWTPEPRPPGQSPFLLFEGG